MRQPFRIEPALPAHLVKTYRISAPLATHWQTVTCEQAQCDAWQHGWVSFIDEATELGQRQALFIRQVSGRRFTEARNEHGVTEFTFEPGQRCFRSDQHRGRNSRPERYLVVGGDHRGNPRGDRYEHKTAADWVDDMAGQLDKLKQAQER